MKKEFKTKKAEVKKLNKLLNSSAHKTLIKRFNKLKTDLIRKPNVNTQLVQAEMIRLIQNLENEATRLHIIL